MDVGRTARRRTDSCADVLASRKIPKIIMSLSSSWSFSTRLCTISSLCYWQLNFLYGALQLAISRHALDFADISRLLTFTILLISDGIGASALCTSNLVSPGHATLQ